MGGQKEQLTYYTISQPPPAMTGNGESLAYIDNANCSIKRAVVEKLF